jgi:hypothetical protein
MEPVKQVLSVFFIVLIGIAIFFVGFLLWAFIDDLITSMRESKAEANDNTKHISFDSFLALYTAAPDNWYLWNDYPAYHVFRYDKYGQCTHVCQDYKFNLLDKYRYKKWMSECEEIRKNEELAKKTRIITEAQLNDIEQWKNKNLAKMDEKKGEE